MPVPAFETVPQITGHPTLKRRRLPPAVGKGSFTNMLATYR
jgi:hypothetical protein